mmetsp:Transcript_3160/g.4897  ORF Transcript_3160/g.4897 Transcript_3160/m.4897 type:complete len:181 (-) Transcript_3160:115-657(-)
MPLFPPLNFGMVEEGLYRSALPSELNFQFLQTLKLKSILILSPEAVDERFADFLEDFDIQAFYIHNSNAHMPKISPVVEETILQALEILCDNANYPILITCKHGRALTGAVVGCLRKLQKWSMISIFDEYRRYARTRLEQQHEQFIELFDTDLVVISEYSPSFLLPLLQYRMPITDMNNV